MTKSSAKVRVRIKDGLKRFQPILSSAKARDINESDTVTIVTDILEYIFGYDKYSEITSEYSIRGTFCDLAIKLDGKLSFLIEVKAIGLDLKDQHIKQATDYAANVGNEWVGLTNGVEWKIYKILFGKPISSELVLNINLLEMSQKKEADVDVLSLLTKETWQKAGIEHHHSIQQTLNRFTIGAILQSEAVVSLVKRELKRISNDIKPSDEEIIEIIKNEVLKREIVDGDKAQSAQKKVAKSEKVMLRKRKENDEDLPQKPETIVSSPTSIAN
jgi:hypothetical protein